MLNYNDTEQHERMTAERAEMIRRTIDRKRTQRKRTLIRKGERAAKWAMQGRGA